MKHKLSYAVIPLMLVVLLLAGCNSSSNSSTASTVRTQVTTGVITGFGSVFVNGVEFTKKASVPDAQVATFKFDDTAHAQSDLKVGMMVMVKGSVDTATKTGEFESIEFSPELRGPADTLASATTNTLRVMGHDVVTGATTSFEGSTTITSLAALKTELAGASKHPEVEISGRMDSAGVFHATRIAVKADDFAAGGKCQLHGKITSAPTSTAGGTTFTVGDIATLVTSSTILSNLTTTGLTTGAEVEVKGTLSDGVLTATRIESNRGVGEGVEVEDTVSIQGMAAGAISGGSFTLNGPNGAVTVTVNAATDMGGAALSSITANAMLEVEGTVQADGSVLATKVKSETEIESESHGGTDSGGGGGGEIGGGGGGGGGGGA
jgi:uncharacterized protein DUF5666